MISVSDFFSFKKIDLQSRFDFPINYVFSHKRKTISIQVYNECIKVMAPNWTPKITIQRFLLKNEKWIKQKVLFKKQEKIHRKNYCSNEIFKILDKDYILKIVKENNTFSKIIDPQSLIIVGSKNKNDQSLIKKEVEKLYKSKAKEILISKTENFSQILGVNPIGIKIKDYKSRWGSCSSKKIISYNWKIIIAPNEIVNYLVVHELCHLIHFNHSKSFWDEVKKVLPEYKNYRKWLRLNSYKLYL